MTVANVVITGVHVDTKVKVRREAQGRKRTTQQRTYTLELDDGTTALYLGNGDFKKNDQMALITKKRKDGKLRIVAYKNLTQKKTGPTVKELRESFILALFLAAFGLLALYVGLSEGSSSAFLIALVILAFALFMVIPAFEQWRALRQLGEHS